MATTVIKKGQPGSRALFRDSFLLHKLMSLTGVLPIGLFMIFHLVVNSYALKGATEFNTAAKAIGYLPFVLVVEIGAIFLPLIFHAAYGLLIVAEMQGPGGNVAHYGYGRNWLYTFQRWSGVVALAYIAFHVYSTTGMRWYYEATGGEAGHELGFKAITYWAMVWRFADPLYLLFYVVGLLSAVFHLSNGLFNFGIRWGITVGKQAQRVSAILWSLVGAGLAVISLWTAVNYHLQGRNYNNTGVSIRQAFPSLDAYVKDPTPVFVKPGGGPGSTPQGTDAITPEGAGVVIPDGQGQTAPPPVQ